MRVELIQAYTDGEQPVDERVARMCERIAAMRDVDLVVLPELWATGFFAFDDYAETAQPLDGAIRESLAKAAEAAGVHLHAGSIVERAADDRLYNTSLLFAPDGSLLHTYRKIHLFGYGARESEILTPGEVISAHSAPFGRVGLGTCYDLRFPELFRAYVDDGVELFLVTSAWPMARVEQWRLFTRARAVENQCFVLAVNAAGRQHGTELAGHSVVVDPGGAVLAEADGRPQSLRVELVGASVAEFRSEFPALADRRIRTAGPEGLGR